MGFELTTFVVIGTDCTCSCKSNCYTITTTAPELFKILYNETKMIKTLGHVKLIIWFSDTAASAKILPLACIYHQTKINTTVKKYAFKFSCLLTWIDQRETTPSSRWRSSEHSCIFLWLYEVVTSGNSKW
jgi:hypothetical protein